MHSDFRLKNSDAVVDNLGDPADNPRYLNGSLTLDFKQEKAQEIVIREENFQWKDVPLNKFSLYNFFK